MIDTLLHVGLMIFAGIALFAVAFTWTVCCVVGSGMLVAAVLDRRRR